MCVSPQSSKLISQCCKFEINIPYMCNCTCTGNRANYMKEEVIHSNMLMEATYRQINNLHTHKQFAPRMLNRCSV